MYRKVIIINQGTNQHEKIFKLLNHITQFIFQLVRFYDMICREFSLRIPLRPQYQDRRSQYQDRRDLSGIYSIMLQQIIRKNGTLVLIVDKIIATIQLLYQLYPRAVYHVMITIATIQLLYQLYPRAVYHVLHVTSILNIVVCDHVLQIQKLPSW